MGFNIYNHTRTCLDEKTEIDEKNFKIYFPYQFPWNQFDLPSHLGSCREICLTPPLTPGIMLPADPDFIDSEGVKQKPPADPDFIDSEGGQTTPPQKDIFFSKIRF